MLTSHDGLEPSRFYEVFCNTRRMTILHLCDPNPIFLQTALFYYFIVMYVMCDDIEMVTNSPVVHR